MLKKEKETSQGPALGKKYSLLGILIILTLTVFFGAQIPNLQFNYVFEDFFPTDDPDLQVYQRFRENFTDDNNYLLIALKNNPTVFEETFLQKAQTLKDSLSRIKETKEVNSLLTASFPIISPTGLISIPALHPEDPERYSSDSSRIFQSSWMPGTLIARDASSMAITVFHEAFTEKNETDSYIDNVIRAVERTGIEYHIVGKIYAQQIYVKRMQEELVIFLTLSILLVILFLILTYRNFWMVVVPLLVVALGVVWLAGFMALTGKSLDLLMVLMPTILFVVGMSDVVHIISRYLEELRNDNPKIVALRTTIKEIGIATFLTSLTTSVGFLTLLTASIKPVQDFGIYMAVGVLFAYIIAFTLLPSILYFLKIPAIAYSQDQRRKWNRYLRIAFIRTIQYRKPILIISLFLVVLSLIGISRIHINTYLIEDLPESDPLKQGYIYFDEKYGGSRPFDAIVYVKDSNSTALSLNILREIKTAEKIIKDNLPTSQLISPVFLAETLNQAQHGGNDTYFRLPEGQREYKKISSYIRRISKRPESERLITKDGHKARITGRMDDIGSSISLARIDSINKEFNSKIDQSLVDIRVTGSSFLIDKNNEYLVRNMLQGLAIAFGVVALLAGIMFKSFRMIIIALLPNMLPLLMVAGMMGFFNITLKLSTSIVFTIAFGIAVDDTLHLISKLRLELAKGKSLLYALKRSYISTGKAIIVTSLILSGGFLILLFSSFGGTFYTGLLVGITLVLALVIDLTLLPVLLIILRKNKAPKI